MRVRTRGTAVVVAALLPVPLTAGAAAAAPAPVQKWKVTSVSRLPVYDSMNDLAAVGKKSAWAVGEASDPKTGGMAPLVYRWNGAKWAPAKAPATGGVGLHRVDATSDRDVWAFGEDGSTTRNVTAYHWDGRAWRAAGSVGSGGVNAVDAVSPKDVWVATASGLLHWNGRTWRAVSVPGARHLGALHLTSAKNGWAAGVDDRSRAQVWRWNGRAWKAAGIPRTGLGTSVVNGVRQVSAKEAWAVGGSVSRPDPDGDDEYTPLVWRWNGSRWSRVATPAYRFALSRPVPDGRGGLWLTGGPGQQADTLVNLRAGRWKNAGLPTLAGTRVEVEGITHVPGTATLLGVGTAIRSNDPADNPQNAAFFAAR
ncbi:hypothetical protein ACSNOI_27945 [Actinomadura kijaniata]|uniref:hypothetical protein n=1 Tax=Actinomadura kijaniata TaxID=46161 RepID=UPI003F1A0291